ncbi:DUF4864 domain-containing protein [Phormidium sp. CCY1219]|uniref:DUF4864 domain-containing protein n=1 Tax=Phormidium sp. CCY1219 TaxID=2886104 RepID=UPI002D1F93DB|nr:hypothetical protein [Phormidium sp. CCY1219]MEB3828557.1 hypothetical protein [Phormidium sp. CCY1219]
MESFQPWLSYIGIGLGALLGGLVLVWIIVSVAIFLRTKGLPQAIAAFFTRIADGDITGAYQSTTERLQSRTSKKEFAKFVKTNKLHQYQRTTLSIPTVEGKTHRLEVTVITKNGREIPLLMELVKSDDGWLVDALNYNYNPQQTAKSNK